MPGDVTLDRVTKRYGKVEAVTDLTLRIGEGEILHCSNGVEATREAADFHGR